MTSEQPANDSHAVAARRVLLQRLADAGHPGLTLDDAIHAGLLTELEWCEELDRQRDLEVESVPGMLTADELATLAGVSRSAVEAWIKRNGCPHEGGGRHTPVLLSPALVLSWLEAHIAALGKRTPGRARRVLANARERLAAHLEVG